MWWLLARLAGGRSGAGGGGGLGRAPRDALGGTRPTANSRPSLASSRLTRLGRLSAGISARSLSPGGSWSCCPLSPASCSTPHWAPARPLWSKNGPESARRWLPGRPLEPVPGSGAALKEPLQAAEVGLLGSRPERGADPLGGGAAGRGRGRRNCWASRRWEEERSPRGVRWTQLEHRGPCFAPPYEPLPDGVRFYYDGEDCPGPPATAGRAPPGLLLRRRWGCPWGQGRPGPWETLALRPEPGRAPSKSAVERPPEGSATEVPSPAAAAQGCSCQAGGGWARPCVLELAQLASAAAAFPLCPRACSRTTLWVRPGPWGLGAGCPRAPGRAAA